MLFELFWGLYFAGIPRCITWIPGNAQPGVLAFCNSAGPLYVWDLAANDISLFPYTNGFDSDITLLQWHHSDSSKFAAGHSDGSISLFFSGKSRVILLSGAGLCLVYLYYSFAIYPK